MVGMTTKGERVWYVGTSGGDPSPSITTGAGPDDTPDPETCVYVFLTRGAAVDWIRSNGYAGTLEPIECWVEHPSALAGGGRGGGGR